MNTPLFFTAGPSQLHPQYIAFYQQAMDLHLGSLNHRSEAFRKIYQETDLQLRQLMNIPSTHEIYFTGSASEIWERMLMSLVDVHSFHFVKGSFSKRFYEYSTSLGKKAIATTAKHGQGFSIADTTIPIATELICTTQNETSAGVWMNEKFYQDLHSIRNKALICADLVSIAPIADVDYNIVDSSFFSVQKAFGMPPGLGVWIANNSCLDKAITLKTNKKSIGAHHNLLDFHTNYKKWETPSTPNVLAIYILGKIAAYYNDLEKSNWMNTILQKKKMIDEFVANSALVQHLVTNVNLQSPSVIVLQTSKPSSTIIKALATQNIHVSSGYGATKDAEIRIANFPTTSIDDMEQLIAALRVISI
jgi:phosphoserine aminotransferase